MFFSEDPDLSIYFEEVAEKTKEPQKAASFVGTILIGRLKNKNKTLTIKILINEIAGPKIIDSGIIEKNINKLFSKYLFSM